MTDPHRDPTRAEDVEEALGWLIEEARRPQGKAPRPPVVVRRRAGVIRDAIRALRERLEEAKAQNERRSELIGQQRRALHRLRRRADRLEEAVREATNLLGTSVPTEQIERVLLNALDSREDEGDDCTCGREPMGGGMVRNRDPDCPVHADANRGDRNE